MRLWSSHPTRNGSNVPQSARRAYRHDLSGRRDDAALADEVTAFVAGPRVLLLDEPTEGLQPSYVDRILETVSELRATGTAMLLVEQKVEAALAVADRIAKIDIYLNPKGKWRFKIARIFHVR